MDPRAPSDRSSPPIVLVSHALCPYVQRAAIVLAEKGVPFDKQIADQARAHGISEADVVRDVMLVHQPRKEFVRVDELAALAVFLSSDAAASMTATAIAMDGGWTQH